MSNNKKNNRKNGDLYEDIALQYLLSRDFIFIDKNFYSKYGEIDLIMQKGEILHFIEVKSSSSFNPLYKITDKKLEKMIKTIYIFCDKNNIKLDFCIDAIGIYKDNITFIENITI